MKVNRKHGYARIDTVIIIILVLLFTSVLLYFYQTIVVAARETALKTELGTLRLKIRIFRGLAGRYPDSVPEMLKRDNVNASFSNMKFTDYFRSDLIDEGGNPVDPFGNRYIYENGKIYSSTKNYEKW